MVDKPLDTSQTASERGDEAGKGGLFTSALEPTNKSRPQTFLVKYVPWVLYAAEGQPMTVSKYMSQKLYDSEMKAINLFIEQQEELTSEEIKKQISEFNLHPLHIDYLPVYNTPVIWLKKAIDSVLNQYYPYWELCIADDGSTRDEVRAVLRAYALKDKRIMSILFSKNSGISAASNVALTHAAGDFIALLDHDDEITPDALLSIVPRSIAIQRSIFSIRMKAN